MRKNVQVMRENIGLSFGLGFLSIFAFFFAAESLEVKGKDSAQEIVAGCIALAVSMAIFQFLVSRRSARNMAARWPNVVSMLAPLFAFVLLIAALEPRAFLLQGVPALLTGCAGALAGALAASNRDGRGADTQAH